MKHILLALAVALAAGLTACQSKQTQQPPPMVDMGMRSGK